MLAMLFCTACQLWPRPLNISQSSVLISRGMNLQALSESMYDLAHTGAQRVAKLCREPSGLACWALELLEEQACMVCPKACYSTVISPEARCAQVL